MKINNETVGISAEIAIANTFNVEVNPQYAQRANREIVSYIQPYVTIAFKSFNIPSPVIHCAERRNPVDFMLCNNQTLSVKSNKENSGMIAPQVIGQASSKTYFDLIDDKLNYDVISELNKFGLEDNRKNRARMFKEISLNRIGDIINVYWIHLLSCDYLLYLYNIITKDDVLLDKPLFKMFKKCHYPPKWDITKFSFTRSLDTWNDSNTLKYCNISIGEFQVHKNRDCLKFRFNLDGIVYLLDNNLISYS